MGWSCTAKASWVLDAFSKACIESTGSSNVYEANGTRYFFETSRREYEDGRVTGTVWRFLEDGEHVRRSGGFSIDADGKIVRAPKFLKDVAPDVEEIARRYDQTYGTGRIAIGSGGLSFDDANDPELLGRLKQSAERAPMFQVF